METSPAREQQIKKLLRGTIDPHIHSGPSIAPRGLAPTSIHLPRSASRLAPCRVALTIDTMYSSMAGATLTRRAASRAAKMSC